MGRGRGCAWAVPARAVRMWRLVAVAVITLLDHLPSLPAGSLLHLRCTQGIPCHSLPPALRPSQCTIHPPHHCRRARFGSPILPPRLPRQSRSLGWRGCRSSSWPTGGGSRAGSGTCLRGCCRCEGLCVRLCMLRCAVSCCAEGLPLGDTLRPQHITCNASPLHPCTLLLLTSTH